MIDQAEPTRLRDADSGAPSRLRDLFDAAARDLPTPAELARLEARLQPLLGDAPAPVPPSNPGRLSPALKLGLGVLALGGVGMVVALSARDTEKSVRVTGTSTGSTVTSAPATSSAAPAPSAPALPPTATAPLVAPPAVSAPGVRPPASAREGAPARPSSAASGLPEDRLLEKARAALRQDPALSLALTREHQQRFAGGVLTQEREVIAIDALRRLGRSAEADRRAERFEQRYPGSAHQRKLDTPPKQ
jgi:hypothetical protein